MCTVAVMIPNYFPLKKEEDEKKETHLYEWKLVEPGAI